MHMRAIEQLNISNAAACCLCSMHITTAAVHDVKLDKYAVGCNTLTILSTTNNIWSKQSDTAAGVAVSLANWACGFLF